MMSKMPIRQILTCIVALGIAAFITTPAALHAGAKTLILVTTTSTQDSGLLDMLVPLFEKNTGFVVKTIAAGSGQALAMAKKGEADVLLVHSPDDEKAFMRQGYGGKRLLVMHNDFVIVGPTADRAGIRGAKSVAGALKKIAASGALFISRGDNSGTHAREKSLWKAAGIKPEGKPWHQETGLGMGQTLAVAAEKRAYCLTDRGTYLALKKKLGLDLLLQGDRRMRNVYHVITLNEKKFSSVNGAGGRAFAKFMVSQQAQAIIKKFGVDKYGSPLFFPDAGK